MGVGWWGNWISASACSARAGGAFIEDAKSANVHLVAAFGLDGEGVGTSG